MFRMFVNSIVQLIEIDWDIVTCSCHKFKES